MDRRPNQIKKLFKFIQISVDGALVGHAQLVNESFFNNVYVQFVIFHSAVYDSFYFSVTKLNCLQVILSYMTNIEAGTSKVIIT